jgi:hypothetical protein
LKTITHILAAAALAVWGFILTPAGQAILNQYPKLASAFAGITTLFALYHSPKAVKVLIIALFMSMSLHAQTPAPKPLESAWNVAVNGNFSSLSNQPTNNGVLISTAIRMATHWNLRADTYIMQAPSITVVLGGPEYRFSLAHLFKNSTGAINAQNTEVFLNTGVGDAHSTAIVSSSGPTTTTVSTSKFAYSVGGGFDIAISPTVSIRPLDIKYIRSSMITGSGQLIGNHLDFAAGLGLHF